MRILQQSTVADYYPVNWDSSLPQYMSPVATALATPVHGVEVASVFSDPANALAPPAGCIGCAAPPLGEIEEATPGMVVYSVLSMAGTITGAYHGYKRNKSIGWALGWALLGGMFPVVTIPISLAQGYGKTKGSK